MHFSPAIVQRLRRIQHQIDQLRADAPPRAVVVAGSPRLRKDVIVFTGSFNPPTRAHLAMLKQAQHYARAHGSMQVYAAFSKQTVDKETVERPLLLDRIMLLQELLAHRLPRVGILLFNRGLYVEQAQAMRTSLHGVRRILFLMGYDKIVQILDPHYYQDRDAALRELFQQAELLVAPRGDDGAEELQKLVQQPQNAPFARYIHALPLDTSYRAVSSTRVRAGEPSALCYEPWEVRQFIRTTHAYAPPVQRPDGSTVDRYAEREQELHALLHEGNA
ncbi:MAG TPA: hypothetical protein VHZ51_04245 [Ktedonobacteraceae bacterium]|nr:hypothetical protein [Ktedonobacteraceae bacterium]